MQPEKNLIFLKNLADFPLNNYIQPVVGSPDITGLGFFIHVQNAFFFQKSRLFFICQNQQLTAGMVEVGHEHMGHCSGVQ